MRQTFLAVLGAFVLALAVGPAAGIAQPPPPPGEGGPPMGRAGRMAKYLGLTDKQQEDIRKLMDDRRADHQALRDKAEKNREAMQAALESDNPDAAAVGLLAIEAHKLHQQEKALRDAQDKAIRDLLTPDQKVKFDAMKALREQGMGGRPPEGGFGPRPNRAPWPRE